MNSARHLILNQIRHAVRGRPNNDLIMNKLQANCVDKNLNEKIIVDSDLVALFRQKLTQAAGTMAVIHSIHDISVTVLGFLQQHHLPHHTMVVDSYLKDLNWPHPLHVAYRAAHVADSVSVCRAFAGIAETGSLVLLSGPASPTTLNFLPAYHLVVLPQTHLVKQMEAVWIRLRAQSMPRTVNIITGPSRTADIEQTLQVGAHGPKQLHIILVENWENES